MRWRAAPGTVDARLFYRIAEICVRFVSAVDVGQPLPAKHRGLANFDMTRERRLLHRTVVRGTAPV